MKTIIQIAFLYGLVFLTAKTLHGKTDDELKKAISLQTAGKWGEALPIFKSMLRSDSGSVELLWRTSYLYSQLGSKQPDEKQKQSWYRTAEYLGKKAIKTQPKHANAHYAYALALGRMNENASSRTKIDYAKSIKTEAELALRYDSTLAGPHHILGRWHRIVAGFNFFERTMIQTVFGGMPGGTYDQAVWHFKKAIALEPNVGIHYYELAITYKERDESSDMNMAIDWLKRAMKLPLVTETDREHRKLCEKLLAELKS